MSETKIFKNRKSDIEIKSTCTCCKKNTNHKILTDIEIEGKQYDIKDKIHVEWGDSYQTIQCLGCENISFRQTHQNSNDVEYYEGPHGCEGTYIVTEKLYPNPKNTRLEIANSYLLPINLRMIYKESLSALNNELPVLTGIGIRAIIETICKDQKTAGNNLLKKIDDLVTQGALTPSGSKILHQLRILGNDAAHDVKPHTSEQLNLAFNVIDHLLAGVYILPQQANNTFSP